MNNFYHENLQRQEIFSIQIKTKENIHIFWSKQNVLILECDFNPKEEQFSNLDGEIGQAIAQSQLSDKIKKERLFEALSHAVWNIKID